MQYVAAIVNTATRILKWMSYCVVGSLTMLGAASVLGVI